MNNTLKTILLSAVTAISFTGLADATELKQSIVVDSDLVTIADLFIDAEGLGAKVVLSSPKPGKSKQYSAKDIMQITKRHGLTWDKPDYIKRVNVKRNGTGFDMNDLKPLLLDYVQESVTGDKVSVKIYGRQSEMFIPVTRDLNEIHVNRFEMQQGNKRFMATILIPDGDDSFRRLNVSGMANKLQNMPILSRKILPGDIIQATDIIWKETPVNRIQRNMVQAAHNMVGMTVKRPITAGVLVRQNDVMRPIAVKKGSSVSVNLKAGGLQLTMTGRALEHGGIGDVIRIKNTASNRTFEATIISKGKAVVQMPAATTVASNNNELRS